MTRPNHQRADRCTVLARDDAGTNKDVMIDGRLIGNINTSNGATWLANPRGRARSKVFFEEHQAIAYLVDADLEAQGRPMPAERGKSPLRTP